MLGLGQRIFAKSKAVAQQELAVEPLDASQHESRQIEFLLVEGPLLRYPVETEDGFRIGV